MSEPEPIWYPRFCNAVNWCFKSERVKISVLNTAGEVLHTSAHGKLPGEAALIEMGGNAFKLIAIHSDFNQVVSIKFGTPNKVFIDNSQVV